MTVILPFKSSSLTTLSLSPVRTLKTTSIFVSGFLTTASRRSSIFEATISMSSTSMIQFCIISCATSAGVSFNGFKQLNICRIDSNGHFLTLSCSDNKWEGNILQLPALTLPYSQAQFDLSAFHLLHYQLQLIDFLSLSFRAGIYFFMRVSLII